jgi:MFS family permease
LASCTAQEFNSILEGAGTALLIPRVYVLVTRYWTGLAERVRAFGLVSAAGGIGAATGPLIGGWITASFGWRAAFLSQALIIVILNATAPAQGYLLALVP